MHTHTWGTHGAHTGTGTHVHTDRNMPYTFSHAHTACTHMQEPTQHAHVYTQTRTAGLPIACCPSSSQDIDEMLWEPNS